MKFVVTWVMAKDAIMEEQQQEIVPEQLIDIKMQYCHHTFLSGSICF